MSLFLNRNDYKHRDDAVMLAHVKSLKPNAPLRNLFIGELFSVHRFEKPYTRYKTLLSYFCECIVIFREKGSTRIKSKNVCTHSLLILLPCLGHSHIIYRRLKLATTEAKLSAS